MISIAFFWLSVVMIVVVTVGLGCSGGRVKYQVIAYNALLLMTAAMAKYLGM